jgi:hypothetical protein
LTFAARLRERLQSGLCSVAGKEREQWRLTCGT